MLRENCLDEDVDEWLCPICHNICDDPMINACEHFVCKACSWIAVCPLCRLQWKAKESRLVKNIVGRLRMRCPDGCGIVTSISNLGVHKSVCDGVVVGCPNGCGLMAKRGEFSGHDKVCTESLERCAFCNTMVKRKKMTTHVNCQCPMAIHTCVCKVVMTKREFDAHRLVCDEVFVKCDIGGCRKREKRKNMAKHNEEAAQHHVALLIEEVRRLKMK